MSVAGALAGGAAMLGCVVGAAVSPYGMELVRFPLQMSSRSHALVLISEWRPLAFDSLVNVVFLIEAVVVLALLMWRRAWWRTLLGVVVVAAALMAVRNEAIAVLALVPIAAPLLPTRPLGHTGSDPDAGRWPPGLDRDGDRCVRRPWRPGVRSW
ncbi:MAG: hypothetical protein R2698_09920 [Microthrixaceae bacterium]